MSRRKEVSLEDQLDYDTAACRASEVVAGVVYGPSEDILDDEDIYIEALKVLKALAEGGWLDPARLSVVQIDDLLGGE